jgi:signal transduction histidine kinase
MAAAGYVIVFAEDADQAVMEFEHHKPALVLIERRLRAVRDVLPARGTPVVTGDIDEASVVALLEVVARRDALEEMQRRRQQLAAHVVHDLRVPLTSVSANLQYVLRDRQLSENAAGAARDALDAVDVATRMATDLLDLAMADQGALTPRMGAVDLPRMLEDIRRLALRRMEGEIQQQITISTRLERPHIVADPALLRRVMENLVDNAVKYAPSGDTIHIEARTFSPEWIELRVRDRGPGVPEPYRELVFEQYAQLDREAELYLRGGRGLGLAFCKIATAAHGGRIWVEDNEPRGACFCVRLPQLCDGSVHM